VGHTRHIAIREEHVSICLVLQHRHETGDSRVHLQFPSEIDKDHFILVFGACEERQQGRGLRDDFLDQHQGTADAGAPFLHSALAPSRGCLAQLIKSGVMIDLT
jgi:hypothetical protein